MSAVDTLTIKTNLVPRFLLEASELTARERAWFDYVDWDAIDAGKDSATFFRYRGQVYDLAEISAAPSGMFPDARIDWQGYAPDSFFSGIVVRVSDDGESIVVGRYCS